MILVSIYLSHSFIIVVCIESLDSNVSALPWKHLIFWVLLFTDQQSFVVFYDECIFSHLVVYSSLVLSYWSSMNSAGPFIHSMICYMFVKFESIYMFVLQPDCRNALISSRLCGILYALYCTPSAPTARSTSGPLTPAPVNPSCMSCESLGCWRLSKTGSSPLQKMTLTNNTNLEPTHNVQLKRRLREFFVLSELGHWRD